MRWRALGVEAFLGGERDAEASADLGGVEPAAEARGELRVDIARGGVELDQSADRVEDDGAYAFGVAWHQGTSMWGRAGSGEEHRHPAAVGGVLLRECSHQVAFFERHAEQDEQRQPGVEQQERRRHRRLRPQEHQQARHERMPDEAVRPVGLQPLRRRDRPRLAQAEQPRVVVPGVDEPPDTPPR